MLVCHCKAVTECQVREAVSGGARTRRQVGRRCGAGTECGGCHTTIDDILEATRLATVSLEFAAAE